MNAAVASLPAPRPRALSDRVIKTHLDNIIAKRLSEERIYKTGTNEEHGELDQLLDDYISLQDDWEDEKNEKSTKTKKEKLREEEAKAILASSLVAVKLKRRSGESEAEGKDEMEARTEAIEEDAVQGMKRLADGEATSDVERKAKKARFGHDTGLVELFEAKARAELVLQRERQEDDRRERAADRQFHMEQLQMMLAALWGARGGFPPPPAGGAFVPAMHPGAPLASFPGALPYYGAPLVLPGDSGPPLALPHGAPFPQ